MRIDFLSRHQYVCHGTEPGFITTAVLTHFTLSNYISPLMIYFNYRRVIMAAK